MNSSHLITGKKGEAFAIEYLKKTGYKLLAKRYRYHRGEIDIIAREGNTLVFIEVKTRKTTEFGYPEESVSPAKQNKLKKTAYGYLEENKFFGQPCRFDVISLVLNENGKFDLHHIKDAF